MNVHHAPLVLATGVLSLDVDKYRFVQNSILPVVGDNVDVVD